MNFLKSRLEFKKMNWKVLKTIIMLLIFIIIPIIEISIFITIGSNIGILNTIAIIGAAMFGIGFIVEAWADYTKFNHKLHGEKWCTDGLWKYSRHPNYFGNILLWFGIFIFCFSYDVPLWTIMGPLWTTFLLVFVSGLPFLEASADKKYGEDKEYLRYKNETSILIPWFK